MKSIILYINESLQLGKTRNTVNLTIGYEKQKDFARLLNDIWGKRHHNITVTPSEQFATVDYVSENDIIKIACLVDNMFQPSNWNFEEGEYDKNNVDCAYHYIPDKSFLTKVQKLQNEIEKENEKVAAIAREINW